MHTPPARLSGTRGFFHGTECVGTLFAHGMNDNRANSLAAELRLTGILLRLFASGDANSLPGNFFILVGLSYFLIKKIHFRAEQTPSPHHFALSPPPPPKRSATPIPQTAARGSLAAL